MRTWSGSGVCLFSVSFGGANKTGKLLNNEKVAVVTKQIRLLFRQCIYCDWILLLNFEIKFLFE